MFYLTVSMFTHELIKFAQLVAFIISGVPSVLVHSSMLFVTCTLKRNTTISKGFTDHIMLSYDCRCFIISYSVKVFSMLVVTLSSLFVTLKAYFSSKYPVLESPFLSTFRSSSLLGKNLFTDRISQLHKKILQNSLIFLLFHRTSSELVISEHLSVSVL